MLCFSLSKLCRDIVKKKYLKGAPSPLAIELPVPCCRLSTLFCVTPAIKLPVAYCRLSILFCVTPAIEKLNCLCPVAG